MSTTLVKCPRCNGTGLIPRFGHYAKGVCFRCGGGGQVRQRVRPDGTADHDHRLGMVRYWLPPGERGDDACVLCGLPVTQWPTLVPAHWFGDAYVVYLPAGQEHVPAKTRSKGQVAVRTLVAERVPNARIKWINR